eukprot:m.71944 g.71944  ORF g.71944 m.71944 type:complete len:198 (+) comp12291_c1_seq1:118-711(+)
MLLVFLTKIQSFFVAWFYTMSSELGNIFAKRSTGKGSCIIEPSETAGGLYLSSGSFASDLISLQKKDIKVIVNVADDVPNYHEGKGFKYVNLMVTDFGQDAGISRVFSECFKVLETASLARENVLVHCAAGANRSATVVIAWIMYSKKLPLAEAWKHVKAARPGICPLRDNREQLIQYELDLLGSNSITLAELKQLR